MSNIMQLDYLTTCAYKMYNRGQSECDCMHIIGIYVYITVEHGDRLYIGTYGYSAMVVRGSVYKKLYNGKSVGKIKREKNESRKE